MLVDVLHYLQGTLGGVPLVKAAIALLLVSALAAAAVVKNGTIRTTRRQLKHLQQLGIPASNMSDQFDPKYDVPADTETNGPIRIKSIFIHPIKSCSAIEVQRARLTKIGLLYDRCFAFSTEVSDPDTGSISWKFISQRTKPLMSQIKTELWVPHNNSDPQDSLVQAGGCVVLSFPDPDPPTWTRRLETFLHTWNLSEAPRVFFVAPLQPTPFQMDKFGIKIKKFGIHYRQTSGLDLGSIPSIAAAMPKLKRYLHIQEKRGLTLMKCTPNTLIRTDENLAPLKNIGTPAVHGYTDEQPVNINSLSSVHAVSALVPPENQPLNALRYRANIWVTGAPAFAEDAWKRCQILPDASSLEPRAKVAPKLSVVCRTHRCTMPNVNPETGTVDHSLPPPGKKKGKPQPSTTLLEHRTVEDSCAAALGYLGVHCVPEDHDLEEAKKQGEDLYIEVGDVIEVLETGEHYFGATRNDY